MSKNDFLSTAEDLEVSIAGQSLNASPKEFSTGSVGYHINGKITLADGTRFQVSGNAVAIGSKDWD